jgi:hypothetical protein
VAELFLDGIDLTQTEVLNAVIQNLAVAPSTPMEGQLYYDTAFEKLGLRKAATWAYLGVGDVSTVSVVNANGFAGSVATATTTPAITITTTVTGLLKGNGTAVSAASAGTDYEVPITFSTGLTRSTNTVTVNPTQNITRLSNLTSNGLVATSGGDGTLGVDTTAYAPIASPTFTGTPAAPTAAAGTSTTQVATTAFVTNAVSVLSQGLDPKPTAYVATAAALPAATYANGTSGVGATLTGDANGQLTVDGVALTAGDVGRWVLVKNQAAGLQNGLYKVTAPGDAGTPFILTRAPEMDTAAEFPGAYVIVEDAGTANANSFWVCTNTGDPTVGTTAVTFSQLNGATQLVQGTGISISGNTVSLASGVATPGTYYGGVTVDTYGRVTAGNADLTAADGIAVRTAAGSYTARSVSQGAGISVTNGDGVSGNPTVAVNFGSVCKKYGALIGNGSSTSFTVNAATHGCTPETVTGKYCLAVQLYDASTGGRVYSSVSVDRTSGDVTLTFAVAPSSNAYFVVIIG